MKSIVASSVFWVSLMSGFFDLVVPTSEPSVAKARN
jgi:hypothetical protein